MPGQGSNSLALVVTAIALLFVAAYAYFVFRSTRQTVIPVIIYGSLAAFLAVVFGTVIVPYLSAAQPPAPAGLRPYNVAELAGREIYKREGCFYCHSQFVRLNDRGLGPVSKAEDYYYDSPHLLGTERTGPDLSNVGGRFPDEYHRRHHKQPRAVRPGSVMPPFDFLNRAQVSLPAGGMAAMCREWSGRLPYWPLPSELRFELKDPARPATLDNLDFAKPVAVDTEGHRYTYYSAAYRWGESPEAGGRIFLYIKDPRRPEGSGDLPEGRYATQGWRRATEMDVLVTYIQSLGTRHRMREYPDVPDEYYYHTDPKTGEFEPRHAPTSVKFSTRFITQARGIFLDKCAHCHGNNGKGDGPAGRDFVKKPANFTEEKFRTYPESRWFWRISEGVPGTEMPAWKELLTEEQRWWLVRWLQYVAKTDPKLISGTPEFEAAQKAKMLAAPTAPAPDGTAPLEGPLGGGSPPTSRPAPGAPVAIPGNASRR
ncbi:MAG: cbb3-type cytochrome c oxidase subunit II [Armatimonadetes bacterium]|nr:cbb3-type cytochrome c oxidase subunit II [Armatimonadota bacterium]